MPVGALSPPAQELRTALCSSPGPRSSPRRTQTAGLPSALRLRRLLQRRHRALSAGGREGRRTILHPDPTSVLPTLLPDPPADPDPPSRTRRLPQETGSASVNSTLRHRDMEAHSAPQTSLHFHISAFKKMESYV